MTNQHYSSLNYSERLQLHIRTHEDKLSERSMTLLKELQQDIYLIDSFDEFRDVAGIINNIPSDIISISLGKLPVNSP